MNRPIALQFSLLANGGIGVLGGFLLLQNPHSRHPWRLRVFAPRQLLSYKDVVNAENAGAFFCPASPKAPTVGALPPAFIQVVGNC